MNYLLDSNTCIRYLNGRAPSISTKLQSCRPEQIFVCSVVKFEMLYGAMRSTAPHRMFAQQLKFFGAFASLAFDDNAANHCGKIRAELAEKGTPIGPYDLQIAAIALVHDLTLVTHNTSEFSRVLGLKIEDWEQ